MYLKVMKKILLILIMLTEILSAQDSLKITKFIDTTHQIQNYLCGQIQVTNKIFSKDFNGGIIFSPLDLVQYRVPGFIYNNINSNDPNPYYSFQVRGISSLLSESIPSYLLDGAPISSCDFIIPENIHSITIFPDLVSTAENFHTTIGGMLVINSKEALDTTFSISYNVYTHFESFKEKYYRNANQYRDRISYWKKFENFGYTDELEHLHDFGGNTDWLDVISRHKISHSHNLTLGKRFKKTSFNLMLTYKDLNSILKKNYSKILNGHLIISQSLFEERLKLNATLVSNNKKYSQINYNPAVFVDGYNAGNLISYAEIFNPTVVEMDQAGNYPVDTLYKNQILQNPSEILNNATDRRSSNTNFAVINADFKMFRGLSLNAGFSTLKNSENIDLFGKLQDYSNPLAINSRLIEKDNDYKQRNFFLALKFDHSFKNHNIRLGIEKRIFNYESKNIFYDSTRFDNSISWSKGENLDKFNINNLHLYISYFYSDIFGLNAGLQNDNIKISDQIKDTMNYQPHTRVMISLKKLFKNVNWISNINIVSSYTIKREPNSSINALYNWGNEYRKEKDIGIEASFLQNNLRFQLKYYKKDIFNTTFFATGLGFYQFDIDNSGFELKFQCHFATEKFGFMQEFCFTNNKSHQISNVDHLAEYPMNIRVPIGNFKGYYFAGFADVVDVEKFTPLYFTDDGELTEEKFKAKNGVIGNGLPKYYIGVFNKVNYKRFEISFLLKSAFRFEIRNLEYTSDLGTNNIGKNITVTVPSNYIYSLRKDTDYGVLKGGYTKIDNVTLKYTIPIKALKISTFEVYFSVNNPYIFSHNYGIDGEMLNISAVEPGIFYYKNYPETIIYQLGFGVNL